MKISCEAPLSWMREVSKHIDYEYALAHRLGDANYLKHYRKAIKAGKMVMLDNSAFELGEAFDSGKFLDAYEILLGSSNICPTNIFLIAPDVLGDREANYKKVVEFKKIASERVGRKVIPQIYATIQGKDLKDRIESFNDLVLEGFLNFTVPGGWSTHDGKMQRESESARIDLMREISTRPYQTFHLLGCIEPNLLFKYGSINKKIETVDSSFPVACALNDILMTPNTKKQSIKIDENFYIKKFNRFQKKLLIKNINCFKEMM